jgi:hypothetical protein
VKLLTKHGGKDRNKKIDDLESPEGAGASELDVERS